jgi:hypothetical protein
MRGAAVSERDFDRLRVAAAATLSLAAAVGLARWHFSADLERTSEGPLGSGAFAALAAFPALLTLAAGRGREVRAAAGVMCFGLVAVTFLNAVLIPLGVLLLRSADEPGEQQDLWHALRIAGLISIGMLAAGALLLHADPVSAPNSYGGSTFSGDVVTATESTLSLSIVALGVVLAVMAQRHVARRSPVSVPHAD